MSPNIVVSDAVKEALKYGYPVVALESTIITHGMDFPLNYETAKCVQDEVTRNGAIPATIAILDGVIRIGLSDDEILSMAKSGNTFAKCSTRDLAYAISKKMNGSTTVAATMVCASRVGIKVFVTGGIGGVHFGDDLDISADLTELGRTPMIVVCAGIKSILDINRTLEVLETLSVPVIGYQTDTFPEFYFSEGDHKVKIRAEDHSDIAGMFQIQQDLGIKSGMVVGVPVPKESSADKACVKLAILSALDTARDRGLRGSEITPFLLKEINNLTSGESSKSNVALIKNNAKHGAIIANRLEGLHFGPSKGEGEAPLPPSPP